MLSLPASEVNVVKNNWFTKLKEWYKKQNLWVKVIVAVVAISASLYLVGFIMIGLYLVLAILFYKKINSTALLRKYVPMQLSRYLLSFMATTSVFFLLPLLLIIQANPTKGEVAGVQDTKTSVSSVASNSVSSIPVETQVEKDLKIEIEKNRKLEESIALATYVNVDIPEEQDDAPKLTQEEVKQANIAYTRDTQTEKKLLDVLTIVDGDTIIVSQVGTLRLIGVDTPETKDPRKEVQCFGKEASDFTKINMRGKKVWLEFDGSQGRLDKYARTLAYVYREDGFFLNKELITQGYANEYTYNKPYQYQPDFITASKKARENKLGLWAEATCNGDAKQPAIKLAPVVVPVPTPTVQPVPVAPVKPADPNASKKFNNCTEAKGAGKGNMTKGDGWYEVNTHLDRDKDGLACDK